MIENFNKTDSQEFVDYKKYIGVGSVNILCVNPNNAKLAMYGWNVPDEADEPKYIVTKERDGSTAGFSNYDGEFRMPLVLAQGSPIFHSSCEGKLGIALE